MGVKMICLECQSCCFLLFERHFRPRKHIFSGQKIKRYIRLIVRLELTFSTLKTVNTSSNKEFHAAWFCEGLD